MVIRQQESGGGGRRVAVRDGASHALLDDVAKQIIEQLQEDGRRPYARSARRWACQRRRYASGCSGCSTPG